LKWSYNVQILYGHDYSRPSLGQWVDFAVESDGVYATPEFDDEDPFASEIARKVENGTLRAASIGISILEREWIGDERWVTAANVIEISICNVGANSDALTLYNNDSKQLSVNEIRSLDFFNKNEILTMDYSKLALLLGCESNETAVLSAIASLQKSQHENEVGLAIASGKLQAAQKDAFVALFAKDATLGRAILATMSTPAQPQPQIGLNVPNLAVIPKVVSHVSGRESWSLTDWRKNDPEGLSRLPDAQVEKLINSQPKKQR
jgi:HK97 family phage prohead protease